MRVFVLILTVLCLSASPTLAQNNGQGNGNSNGQENGNGGGNNGNGNGPGQNSGNGNSQGNANSQGNGNSNSQENGNSNAGNNGNNGNGANGPGGSGTTTPTGIDGSPSTDATGTVHYSQDHARDLVNAGRAVSLSSLLPELQARSEGTVIDAELLNVQGILVYAVKMLRTDGQVTQEYYYAQSGRFIGSER